MRLLAESRRAGLSFEEAWVLAVRPGRAVVMTNAKAPPVGAVLWPTDSSDRIASRKAVLETKDAYRRSYQRRPPTRRERAAEVLWGVVESRGIGGRLPVRSAA